MSVLSIPTRGYKSHVLIPGDECPGHAMILGTRNGYYSQFVWITKPQR